MGLGFMGCPIANSSTWILMLVLALLYIRYSKQCLGAWHPFDPLVCWDGLSRRAFEEWWPFLRLGLPSCAQICLEWWAFEAMTLITGVLGTSELAASTISMQLVAVSYMTPLGLSMAVSTRVGNALGANQGAGAARSCNVALALCASVSGGISSLWIVVRHLWVPLFTDDADVQAMTVKLLLVMSAFQWFDAMQCIMSGVMRGAGLQSYGAVANFVSQWLVGIPVALLAAFVWGFGLFGVWASCGLGVAVMCCLQCCIIRGIKWERMALEAHAHAQSLPRMQGPGVKDVPPLSKGVEYGDDADIERGVEGEKALEDAEEPKV
jgi:MATE family multidrug resistance protein